MKSLYTNSTKKSIKNSTKIHLYYINMKKVTLQEAKEVMKKLKINQKVITPLHFKKAMQIELEHGKVDTRTNVTKNDILKTGKIALAHIMEFPDYYPRLEKMEEEGNKYWKNKKKPKIILS